MRVLHTASTLTCSARPGLHAGPARRARRMRLESPVSPPTLSRQRERARLQRDMTHLLLAGGGHSHAIALRNWLDDPLPGVTVTLVSPSASTLYSGMVPGWLAGHYDHEEIAIDVEALCRAAGVRFRIGTVVSLDPVARTATLADGETLAWDVLSLDVGSTLTPPAARN